MKKKAAYHIVHKGTSNALCGEKADRQTQPQPQSMVASANFCVACIKALAKRHDKFEDAYNALAKKHANLEKRHKALLEQLKVERESFSQQLATPTEYEAGGRA